MDMCDEGALLSTITVSDIVARADIARQTFYNYFADLDELIFFTGALPMSLESNPFTDIEATRKVYERVASTWAPTTTCPNPSVPASC